MTLLEHWLQGFNEDVIRVLSYLYINTFMLSHHCLRMLILHGENGFNLKFFLILHLQNIFEQ